MTARLNTTVQVICGRALRVPLSAILVTAAPRDPESALAGDPTSTPGEPDENRQAEPSASAARIMQDCALRYVRLTGTAMRFATETAGMCTRANPPCQWPSAILLSESRPAAPQLARSTGGSHASPCWRFPGSGTDRPS